MKKFIFLFFIIGTTPLFCQNLISIGNKNYPCTKTYSMGGHSEDLKILFAKKEIDKLIVFELPFKIKGDAQLLLENGTKIELLDKGLYDSINVNRILYYFSNQDISNLKVSNINYIRYPVVSIDKTILYFTVQNVDKKSDDIFVNDFKRVNFCSIISEFFK